MKTLKLLSIFVFALCLVGSVSAFGIIGGAFDDGSVNGIQSITITEGDPINFNYDFISDSSPMIININLHDSQDEIIIPFATDQPVTTPCSGLPSYVCYTGEETIPSNLNPGSYELIMFADNIGKSKTLYLTINEIPDTNIPVITLLGENPVIVVQGTTYIDAGATAYDVEDGDITANILVTGSVDTNTLGTYVLTYNVQDNVGNSAAQVTRTVNVFEDTSDTTAPVITLLGQNPVNVLQGTTYTDAGATALDDVDGDITANIVVANPVDVNTVGTYIITYNVLDSSNNPAEQVTRTVNVVENGEDTTAPILSVIVPQATTYSAAEMTFEIVTDEPAIAEYSLDGADENVRMSSSDSLKNDGPIDTELPDGQLQNYIYVSELLTLSEGEHTVVFYATDAAGNMATSEAITFTIDLSGTAPTLTVITPEQDKEYDESEITFEIEVDEIAEVTFSLNGGSEITMNYEGISNGVLTFTYGLTLLDGDHTVTFYAIDGAGNTGSATVDFSVDTSETGDKKKKTITYFYQSDYDEQLYLNQFKSPKIIYLEDDDQPEKVLNWWQKFIEWLKNLFGF